MEEITKHYLISGRVQGVGFRAYVHREALELNLRGRVRNLLDGRVEVIAQGPEKSVYLFEAKLKSGPQRGHVENLVSELLKRPVKIEGFRVRKDGLKPWSEN